MNRLDEIEARLKAALGGDEIDYPVRVEMIDGQLCITEDVCGHRLIVCDFQGSQYDWPRQWAELFASSRTDLTALLAVARAVPPAEKLRGLADWLDRYDRSCGIFGQTEVQRDLRHLADALAALMEGSDG